MCSGFQTNPRGVEVIKLNKDVSLATCFRRTLVGLKFCALLYVSVAPLVSDEPSWG